MPIPNLRRVSTLTLIISYTLYKHPVFLYCQLVLIRNTFIYLSSEEEYNGMLMIK